MAEAMIQQPRDFPAIEEILQSERLANAIAGLPRPVASTIIKQTVAALKEKLIESKKPISVDAMFKEIDKALAVAKGAEIRRVINATGILVHTNLGRAPFPDAVFAQLKETLTGYCNVEFDLRTGARGDRGEGCERYLAELSEAEAGTIVNNCAAALFLILNSLANRKNVLISRGELVQIGGGFRIPDILKRAGAKLVEVGTTNITTVADYASHIDDQTALILKVHKSNFVQSGFSEEVPLRELVTLGKQKNIPVVNDLGSGVFVDTYSIMGYAEPTVQQSVRSGADLTCFSGDKLLGGVQAGLIVGRASLIKSVKKNPLFRTMRVDKVVFAVVERLLATYLNGTQATDIPLWQFLAVPDAELYQRGKSLVRDVGNPAGVSVEASKVFLGGGALPEKEIPSVAVCFSKEHKAERLLVAFRRNDPPIICRIEEDRLILDLKAIPLSDYPSLLSAIRTVLGG
ncbi:MAG: L-seryl-tRNA(Sec) selenium transferase [bacterium]|nr:L-seryl-tRNA(Sec) selenium transferase [bacterium]